MRVLLPLPLAGAYDYRVPPMLDIRTGEFVTVPLNHRPMIGVVWDAADPAEMASQASPVADHRLKPVTGILSAPPMTASLRRFIDWVAAYTLSPPGAVLRMAIGSSAALEPPALQAGWMLAGPGGNAQPRMTPERLRVLAAMQPGQVYAGAPLAEAAGVSPGVLRGMADNGLIRPALLPHASRFSRPDPDHPGPVLGGAQAAAAATLVARVAERQFGVTLLTASPAPARPRSIWTRSPNACARAGRPWCCCRRSRCPPNGWTASSAASASPRRVWHSDLTPRTRRVTWRAVAEGSAPVVVGARSALFLPFPDLGLVVVDEEHETAFKQEDGVVYHARDMAVVRARLCPGGLRAGLRDAFARDLANAETGRYAALDLPERHGGAALPAVEPVDLRAHAAGARPLPRRRR